MRRITDWPLVVSEYSSSKALAKAKPWKAGAKPGQGEPPIAFIGLNILVEWGPTTTGRPAERARGGRSWPPSPRWSRSSTRLLSPLKTRTIVPVSIPDRSQARRHQGVASAMTAESPAP